MLLRVVALAALGGFLFGYDLGLIGGAILGITQAFHISDATKEAIVGAAKLGAFFGTFLGGVCMLRYGRRKAISLQAAFFVAGPALMAAAPGPAALVAGRFLVGLGIGASAIVVPAYLAEIAPAKNRGMVVQMYEVMLTLGMLAAVLVNMGLSAAGGSGTWRWMVGLPAIPGVLLLVSLVSLPESPRWLVMRGQLDEALATLHSIITSSSRSSSSSGALRKALRRRSSMPRPAAAAAVGLHSDPSAAAEDAAWLNAVPEAGRPRTAAQKAVEDAEDELLLLWSSVQKEQAAGLELRQAATAAGDSSRPASGSNSTSPAPDAPDAPDARVLVSAVPAGSGGSAPRQFTVQAAHAAAFSLDEEEDHLPKGSLDKQRQQRSDQHQQERPTAGSSGDAIPEPDAKPVDTYSSSGGGGGGGSSGGEAARFKALQHKLHLGGKGGADRDAEGHQQLLGPSAVNSSSGGGGSRTPAPQHPGQDGHRQQQQQQQRRRLVEPGQESHVFSSLWAMLVDIKAVARGPERAAFGIACCLAVFDQATASTAIINYAPEVLSSRMGVTDPNLAITYPAAIALAKVVGTLVAAATVDKYGRKPLLIGGGVGCGLCLFLTAYAVNSANVAFFLATLCLFIFCFSLSWAGLYWVVVSEIFSMGAKSPATSAATSLLFLTGAVVNFMYLSLIQWLSGFAFVLFGVVAMASAWYVHARVPETKGKTLAEIQALLAPPSAAAAGAGAAGAAGVGSGGGARPGPGVQQLGLVGLASGGSAGADGGSAGSPLLPVTRAHAAAAEGAGGGGEGVPGQTGLVELRELMVKDPARP